MGAGRGRALDPGRRARPADPGRRARCRCSGRGGRWGLSEKAARLAGARPAGEEQCRARGGAGRRGRGCLPQAARPRHVGPLECAARRGAPFNSAGSLRPPTRAPPRSTDVSGVARGAGGGHAGGARAGERCGAAACAGKAFLAAAGEEAEAAGRSPLFSRGFRRCAMLRCCCGWWRDGRCLGKLRCFDSVCSEGGFRAWYGRRSDVLKPACPLQGPVTPAVF